MKVSILEGFFFLVVDWMETSSYKKFMFTILFGVVY
jgi:hypothetical protein